MLFMIFLAVFLIAGLTTSAYSGQPEPPEGGEKMVQPATKGKVMIIDDLQGDGPILAFSGECKGVTYHFVHFDWLMGVQLSDLTEEDLTDYRLGEKGFAGCKSEDGGEDLIINKVVGFANTGDMVSADVVLQYLILK